MKRHSNLFTDCIPSPSQSMIETGGTVAQEASKNQIDKMRMRNVFLLSIAFGIDFFGKVINERITNRNKRVHEFRGPHSGWKQMEVLTRRQLGIRVHGHRVFCEHIREFPRSHCHFVV